MSSFDDFVDRVTRRLSKDPELRLEVGRELKSHLEDTLAEYIQAGEDQAVSQQSAIATLGDEGALAELLWQANQHRIRTRKLTKWAIRLVLLPAAFLAVLFYLPANPGRTFQMMQIAFNRTNVPWINDISQWIMHSASSLSSSIGTDRPELAGYIDPMGEVTGDNKFTLYPCRTGSKAALDHAKALLDQFNQYPQLPVYYANYIVQLAYTISARTNFSRILNNRRLDIQLVAALDHGEQIESDNAFYNYMKAFVFQNASSEIEEIDQNAGDTWVISEPDLFNVSLDELRLGLVKPYVRSYGTDLYRMQMDRLLPSQTLEEYIARQVRAVDAGLPGLDYFLYLGSNLCSYSRYLARSGAHEEAIKLSRQVELMGLKLGTGPRKGVIELLVADAIRRQAVLTQAWLYDKSAKPMEAGYYRVKHKRLEQVFQNLLADSMDISRLQQGGLFIRACAPTLIIGLKDLSPYRKVEYVLMDQAAVAYLVMLLLLMLTWSIIRTAVAIATRRHSIKDPLTITVGWQRLLRIYLFALVLPILFYSMYAWSPLGGRITGLNLTYERLVLEYVVVTVTVFILFRTLWFGAVRERAIELGIPAPPPVAMTSRRWLVILGLLLAAMVMCYLFLWHISAIQCGQDIGSPQPVSGYGFILAALTGLLWLLWYIHDALYFWKFRRGNDWDRSVIWRGIVVVVTIAAMITGYLYLFGHEKQSILMDTVIAGSVGIGLWAGYEILFGWYRGMGDGWRFYIMQTRSSIGIVAASILILTLVLGWGSRQAEVAMIRNAESVIGQEVELSHSFRLLKAELEREHDLLMSEFDVGTE